MSSTILILGASGAAGGAAAKAFAEAGWRIRRFDRGRDDMTAAAQGADVILNGLNPQGYRNWTEEIPAITEAVLGAAKASGATIILPGNVYPFGTAPGPWSETTPHAPNAIKGQIRAEMEATYAAAATQGLRTILLRGGDFIAANARSSFFHHATREVSKGRIATMGDPKLDHAWCYLPDWARAAVALADKRHDLAAFEDVPFPGYTLSMDAIRSEIEAASARKIRIKPFPWWLIRLGAPVVPLFREVLEMRYLFDHPHRLDGTKFKRILPEFVATPVRQALSDACGINAEDLPQSRATALA